MNPHPDPRSISVSLRLYGTLLRLCPRELRDEYGLQMLHDFRQLCRAAHRRAGTRAVMQLWPTAFTDIVAGAWAEHYWALRRRLGAHTMETMNAAELDTRHHQHRAEYTSLSIVLPVYNEEARIAQMLDSIITAVRPLHLRADVLVVDDGSTDGTARQVEGLGHAGVRLLRTEHNGGIGHAVRQGIAAAQGELLLWIDAESIAALTCLPRLLAAVEQGGHLAGTAIPPTDGRRRSTPFARLGRALIGRALQLTPDALPPASHRLALGTADVMRTLFSRQTLSRNTFYLELFYLAHRCGYTVAQIPLFDIAPVRSTQRSLRRALHVVGSVARIRWQDLRGTYRTVA